MRSGGSAAKAARKPSKVQPTAVVSRPQRKLRAVPEPQEERPKRTRSVALAEKWGRPPEHATHFTIGKQIDGKWPRQTWKVRGEQTAEDIWPISQLDAGTVCHHWGPGEYRVTWIGTVQGKRRTLGVGRTVLVLPPDLEGEGSEMSQQIATPAHAPAPAPAPTMPPLPDALGQFQTLWGISQSQKDTELARARETFDQQLRNQAQTYDQLLALQAKMMERAPTAVETEKMAKMERSIRRLRRALEERADETAMVQQVQPATLLNSFLGQIAPYIPTILQALPGVLQRFAAGAAAVGQPEVHHRT